MNGGRREDSHKAAGCSAPGCHRLLFGRMGIVRLRQPAEGDVGRGRESTWISLLPLIGAENKTEIQLERRSVSHGGKEPPPAAESWELSLVSSCPCHRDLPLPGLGTSPHLYGLQSSLSCSFSLQCSLPDPGVRRGFSSMIPQLTSC